MGVSGVYHRRSSESSGVKVAESDAMNLLAARLALYTKPSGSRGVLEGTLANLNLAMSTAKRIRCQDGQLLIGMVNRA